MTYFYLNGDSKLPNLLHKSSSREGKSDGDLTHIKS